MLEDSLQINSHSAGVILVTFSAIVFSSAGVFTKVVDSGAWEIIFWRGVFAAGFTTAYIMWRGSFVQDYVRMGSSGWAVAIIGASGTAAFIPAFKLTTMANVMLIYAAAPLIASLLAWVWIKERMSLRVLLGCIGAIAGVIIIVQGSVGEVNLRGDLLALWMTIVMATLMVIYRRFPATPAAGPAALSSLVLLPLAIFQGDPLFGDDWPFAAFPLIQGGEVKSEGDTDAEQWAPFAASVYYPIGTGQRTTTISATSGCSPLRVAIA